MLLKMCWRTVPGLEKIRKIECFAEGTEIGLVKNMADMNSVRLVKIVVKWISIVDFLIDIAVFLIHNSHYSFLAQIKRKKTDRSNSPV